MSEHIIIPPNPPRWNPHPDPAKIHVPGLDANAPLLDQIEQIDQLITIKLQNIDENFASMCNTLQNRILPAVKRYAVGTEPVRESAKFWVSFYEQAAQIRIPTYEDYSSVNASTVQEQEGSQTDTQSSATAQYEEDEEESQQHSRRHRSHGVVEPSMTSTEGVSFLPPSHGAFSSTPAMSNRNHTAEHTFDNTTRSDETWSTSLESPLVRLDRELQNFSREDDTMRRQPVISQPSSSKAAESSSQPLLRNVLRQNLQANVSESNSSTSPLKFRKPKTPVPKHLNPYLPPDTKPDHWNGIVDLSRTPLSTPMSKKKSGRTSPRKQFTPAAVSALVEDSDDDDSFDFTALPPGMSPPKFLSPARKSTVLAKTPHMEAVERITRDLIHDASVQQSRIVGGPQEDSMASMLVGMGRPATMRGGSVTESSMGAVPTPPLLSRYLHSQGGDATESIALDPSLEDMMRRVGLNLPPDVQGEGGPGVSVFTRPRMNNRDSDSSDEDDLLAAPGQPSDAFLMASANQPDFDDDSFGSSNRSSDSLDGNLEGIDMVNPFAQPMVNNGGDGFDEDDSFDDDYNQPEETLFGVPPEQRNRVDHAGLPLRMYGEELLEDTIGIGAQIAQTGRVEESPTPANWGPGPGRG